jgi:hypothetical protein
MSAKLRIIPLTLKQANALVGEWHRHHDPVVGHRWSIGVTADEEIVGAAIFGRPKARMTDQYLVGEVDRLVTNGHEHACSKLYAACARAAEAMGFHEIQTFILKSESGTSLRAAGWTEDKDYDRSAGEFDCPSRPRKPARTVEEKRRFFKKFPGARA